MLKWIRLSAPRIKRGKTMDYYAAIDVSLEQSSVCVVDSSSKIVRETKVASEPGRCCSSFPILGGSFSVGVVGVPETGRSVRVRRNSAPSVETFAPRLLHTAVLVFVWPSMTWVEKLATAHHTN